MNKLLDLLNEYSTAWYYVKEDLQWQVKAWILSKEYGFIKRLVDNDKIDLNKVEENSEIVEYLISTPTKVYENIIMILSISDTPLQDLCVWLK